MLLSRADISPTEAENLTNLGDVEMSSGDTRTERKIWRITESAEPTTRQTIKYTANHHLIFRLTNCRVKGLCYKPEGRGFETR
jgi:hypothetical protein